MKKLFVFDFDGTIVSGHTHNSIIRSQNPDDPEYINGPWGVVHDFPIIGLNDLKNILEVMHQHGHYIAINSFNSYGSIIPEFLKKIDLSEETIAKINIIAKLPKNPASANKNEYIQESIKKVQKQGFSGNATDVFLIDDSKKNITAARENGYQVIHAKSDASHLSQLKETLLIEINNEQEIINKDIEKLQRCNKEIKNKLDQFDNSKKPLSGKDEMTRADLNSNYLANKTIILVKKECLSANQELADKLKTSEENSATKVSVDDSLKQRTDTVNPPLKADYQNSSDLAQRQEQGKALIERSNNQPTSAAHTAMDSKKKIINPVESGSSKVFKANPLQSPQQTSVRTAFLDELKAKQSSRLAESSFFSSPSSFSNQDAKEKEKEKISSKGFSYRQ